MTDEEHEKFEDEGQRILRLFFEAEGQRILRLFFRVIDEDSPYEMWQPTEAGRLLVQLLREEINQ